MEKKNTSSFSVSDAPVYNCFELFISACYIYDTKSLDRYILDKYIIQYIYMWFIFVHILLMIAISVL